MIILTMEILYDHLNRMFFWVPRWRIWLHLLYNCYDRRLKIQQQWGHWLVSLQIEWAVEAITRSTTKTCSLPEPWMAFEGGLRRCRKYPTGLWPHPPEQYDFIFHWVVQLPYNSIRVTVIGYESGISLTRWTTIQWGTGSIHQRFPTWKENIVQRSRHVILHRNANILLVQTVGIFGTIQIIIDTRHWFTENGWIFGESIRIFQKQWHLVQHMIIRLIGDSRLDVIYSQRNGKVR